MSRLFIELYLDEDVDVLIADLVRARSFQAITTQEAGQTGKDDTEQLAHAVGQQKTILTHNRSDFELLAQQYFVTGQTQWHHHRCTAFARRNCSSLIDHPESGNG